MQPDKSFSDSKPSEFGRRGGQGGGGGRSGRRKTPDREVPIYRGGVPEQESTELLHRWLDGDIPDSAMLATVDGDETVDLWNKIHDEAELLRNRTTPLYVHKRIMDSLPEDLYQPKAREVPWYRKTVPINPVMLVAISAGLIAVGVAVARMVMP